ncbi:MAG: hypothetical protein IT233_14175 [Bacteroidia bacterium]|nr:hypothetical protein [Bacteroidia bacterium]
MKKISLLFLLAAALCGTAQVKQEQRKDFEADEEGRDYTTLVGEFGLLLHGKVETEGKGSNWNVTRFNTNLEEQQSGSFQIPDKHYYDQSFVTEDKRTVYYLFLGKKNAFQIVSYDVKSGSSKSVPGTFPSKFQGGDMEILGNSAFIKGYIKKQAVLLKIDLESGQGVNMQLPHATEKMSIENLQVLEKEKKLAVLIEFGDKKKRQIELSVFDDHGTPEGEPLKITKDPQRRALSASLTWLGKEHYIISGTYSSDRDAGANGIFITEFMKGEQLFIQYNSFTDLKNFTEYLSKRRKDKMDKKIQKKKAKGETDYVDALVVDHPVFEFNGEYVYIGECYYPTYRTETTTTYINGKPTTTTRQVFDGYQYTHSTVIGMDKTGKKTWDFCFEMWLDYKPFYHKKFVKKVVEKDELKLIFTTGTQFKSLAIKDGEYKEKDLGKIEFLDENEKLKWAGNVNTEYWFGNYFLAFGTKRVKQEDEKGKKKKKTIFYMVKIRFD